MSDGLVPIIINFDNDTTTNTVVLADENTESFEQLCDTFYQSMRPNLDEFYLQEGERHITKMWVQWCPANDRFLPTKTFIDDTNMRAVIRILGLRRGIDMVAVWLNEID